MSVNTLVDSINWDVVAGQKRSLASILAKHAACGGTVVFYPDEADALHEILRLINALQDAAASDELAVPDEAVRNTRYQVRFRPQAWINNQAVDVDLDDHAPNVWFIEEDSVAGAWDATEKGLDLDFLKFDPFAPKWILDWSGPFEIEMIID